MELLQLVNNYLHQSKSSKELALLKKLLAEKINLLLMNDFAQLVQLLYRIDIDEASLKSTLANRKDVPASEVIADMMIQRVTNTIVSKKQFREDINNIDDSLKW